VHSEVLVVRFPDGTREFRYPEKMLEEGDVIWHDGTRYRVINVSANGDNQFVAIVEPEAPTLGEVLQSEEGAIRLTPFDVAV
jgi:hypothetical protein